MRRPRGGGPARARSGATIVEMAVCLNVLLILMAGLMEHGRLIMTKQVLDYAANEGARQAVVHASTWTTADVQANVNALLGQVPLTSTGVAVTATDSSGNDTGGSWTAATFGKGIAVTVTGDYQRLSALSGLVGVPNPLHLRARAIARSEAN